MLETGVMMRGVFTISDRNNTGLSGFLTKLAQARPRMSLSGACFKRGAACPVALCLVFLLSACAGPLEINTRIDKAALHDKALVSAPVSVYIRPFTDNRDPAKTPFKDPRTIGRVNVPVSDMIGDSLTPFRGHTNNSNERVCKRTNRRWLCDNQRREGCGLLTLRRGAGLLA